MEPQGNKGFQRTGTEALNKRMAAALRLFTSADGLIDFHRYLASSPHGKSQKGPSSCIVYTWPLHGLRYPHFRVYVCAMLIFGAVGDTTRGFSCFHILPVSYGPDCPDMLVLEKVVAEPDPLHDDVSAV